jgi:neutral ceramidase
LTGQGDPIGVARWSKTLGRSMTNRPDDMVARHDGDESKALAAMCRFHLEWTGWMLHDFEDRPKTLAAGVQGIRIGDLYRKAISSELFSPLPPRHPPPIAGPRADIRLLREWADQRPTREYDILARSYAGYQSPKYCDQFPFTRESSPGICDAVFRLIDRGRVLKKLLRVPRHDSQIDLAGLAYEHPLVHVRFLCLPQLK